MSSCQWEGDLPSIIDDGWIYARRNHRCCECGATIKRDDEYKMTIGVWDDEVESYRQCELCGRVYDDLVHMGFCPDYMGLWAYIEEEFEQAEEEES